ncbi:glycerol-3-phosphate responsive antiterminator [Aquibacillus salsiterrae]|uniref:Glycerol uptake operon antiterminator regulatory protein n=1 Tax=Aquibacillus salsiterrae TaxID=2950439 RepID=A0A9X3WBL3_9BACI|nr:glycerol-3-phosphate responsive antiterminator [Aquibacillus salsiterrae]MDC3416642.1 glycerol-3-phosphate responsive antiterminator [Aquibacillus salsiterrae]
MELTGILPAIRNMKDFEKAIEGNHNHVIFLETRLSQIGNLVKYSKQKNKIVFVHADLIQGLKADEFGMEYLVNDLKVDGILSTRGSVISSAKKHKVIAIQRLFALDSTAINHNIKLINNLKPDYIEVLPGIVPSIISEIYDKTGLPIIAGGLIRTTQDVRNALAGGAQAITTSRSDLWN